MMPCTIYLFITTRRYSPLRGLTSSSCGGLRPLEVKISIVLLFLLRKDCPVEVRL